MWEEVYESLQAQEDKGVEEAEAEARKAEEAERLRVTAKELAVKAEERVANAGGLLAEVEKERAVTEEVNVGAKRLLAVEVARREDVERLRAATVERNRGLEKRLTMAKERSQSMEKRMALDEKAGILAMCFKAADLGDPKDLRREEEDSELWEGPHQLEGRSRFCNFEFWFSSVVPLCLRA